MQANEFWPASFAAQRRVSRRDLLWESGGGLGGIALAAMLGTAEPAAAAPAGGAVKVLHFPPRATRVVQLFMAGAASHIDLFDYKPLLEKMHGQESDFGEHVEAFQDGLGPWMKSPFTFRPYGQCGKYLSDPVSPLGDVVDEMAFVHNMIGKTGVHSQATYLQATGFQRPGFPGMGAWISYALGSLNDNLPTFVVLPDHRGFASNGPKNWASAFLPTDSQGTTLFPQRPNPIEDLVPRASYVTNASDTRGKELIELLNRRHATQRPGDARLDARIRSYELAARMQLAAPDALDVSRESAATMRMYGLDRMGQEFGEAINAAEESVYFGLKCLVARRLLERGVRFVQIWSGNDNSFPRRNWDSHENVQRDHGPLARGMAVGTAALIRDLKQRGLLDDTIVLWTTEFGRMPSTQGSTGRDHNPYVFTNWLSGGGIRGGTTYGPSDEWGYKPLDRAAHAGLRHPRHDSALARRRSHTVDGPARWDRSPPDRRAWDGHRRHPDVAGALRDTVRITPPVSGVAIRVPLEEDVIRTLQDK